MVEHNAPLNIFILSPTQHNEDNHRAETASCWSLIKFCGPRLPKDGNETVRCSREGTRAYSLRPHTMREAQRPLPFPIEWPSSTALMRCTRHNAVHRLTDTSFIMVCCSHQSMKSNNEYIYCGMLTFTRAGCINQHSKWKWNKQVTISVSSN